MPIFVAGLLPLPSTDSPVRESHPGNYDTPWTDPFMNRPQKGDRIRMNGYERSRFGVNIAIYVPSWKPASKCRPARVFVATTIRVMKLSMMQHPRAAATDYVNHRKSI